MQSNFLDAHYRHWQDAELLFQTERWANADHLYGMAGECGLKHLMRTFGMPFDNERDQPEKKPDRQHIEKIWVRYETYRSGYLQGVDYALPTHNPFDNWHVAQRYAHRDHFSHQRAEQHRAGAQQVHKLIRQARWEGLI